MLGLPAAERFPALLTVSDFDNGCLVMATSTGGIKRTELTAFSKLRASGLAAVKLLEVGAMAWNDKNAVSVLCLIVLSLSVAVIMLGNPSVQTLTSSRDLLADTTGLVPSVCMVNVCEIELQECVLFCDVWCHRMSS